MAFKKTTSAQDNHLDFLLAILRYLLVAMIPTATMMIVYYDKRLFPFGENSILSIDLWGQYFPTYQQFGRTFSFSEAIYQWTGALGYNNFVQSAFYCRSIFLILFKFIPFDSSIAFVNIVALLRYGLSAVTCQMFLEYKFKDKSLPMMAVSVCYSLCAYAIAFIMQFMWTDSIFLVPLILLGLEMLMEGKSPVTYVLFLTLTIYSNFYLGFGVCLFIGFYFLMEIVKRAQLDSGKSGLKAIENRSDLGKTILRFAVYSLISGLLNAVILIPTLVGLSHSLPANEGTLDFTRWYHTFAENIAGLLPMAQVSYEFGVANICTGLVMFLLIPLYFMNSSVSFREKLASGGFLLVLYSALNYNPLDYVFNGFHFPNQLPGRWSFMFSLAIAIVAASGLSRMRKFDGKALFSSWIIGVFFIYFSKYSALTDEKADKLFKWAVFITAAAVFLALYTRFIELSERKSSKPVSDTPEPSAENTGKKKISWRKVQKCFAGFYSAVFAGLVMFEACSNAITVATEIKGGFGVSNSDVYLNVNEVIRDFGEKYQSEDDLYRCESNMCWTYDDGLLGGYNSITYYGSTLNGDAFTLLRGLGNGMYAKNVSIVYNNTSPVQNSIFGIRYFLDRAKNMDTNVPGLVLKEESVYYNVWENPSVFPMAFGASDSVMDFTTGESLRPIQKHNEFLNKIYGGDVNAYEECAPAGVDFRNATYGENEDWNQNYFFRTDESQPVDITYTFTCPSDQPVFIEQNFRTGSVKLIVNDEEREINPGNDRFLYAGTHPAGTEIRLTAHLENINIGCCGAVMYTMDTEKMNAVAEWFRASGLKITSFKNTRIDGTLNMLQTGTVFTSIPQDGGWKVYVDGKKVETEKIGGSLIGFPLEFGAHEISFRYSCPGLALGLIVTLISLAALVFCLYLRRKKPSADKPETEGTAESEETESSEGEAESSDEE